MIHRRTGRRKETNFSEALQAKWFRPAGAILGVCVLVSSVLAAPPLDFQRDIYPTLEKHCFGCQGSEKQKSDFRVDTLSTDLLNDAQAAETWHDILSILNLGAMPPDDQPSLDDGERRTCIDIAAMFASHAKRRRSTDRLACEFNRLAPVALIVCVFMFGSSMLCAQDAWKAFRGPDGSRVAQSDHVAMDLDTSRNLLWRTELPETGWCSPITDGKRLWMGNNMEHYVINELEAAWGYGMLARDEAKMEDCISCLTKSEIIHFRTCSFRCCSERVSR